LYFFLIEIESILLISSAQAPWYDCSPLGYNASTLLKSICLCFKPYKPWFLKLILFIVFSLLLFSMA